MSCLKTNSVSFYLALLLTPPLQLFAVLADVCFLGQAFVVMLVYVWSRRHPLAVTRFGLLRFRAPLLPWVLVGFSLLLGNSIALDLLGMKAKPPSDSLQALSLTRHVTARLLPQASAWATCTTSWKTCSQSGLEEGSC